MTAWAELAHSHAGPICMISGIMGLWLSRREPEPVNIAKMYEYCQICTLVDSDANSQRLHRTSSIFGMKYVQVLDPLYPLPSMF